MQLKMVSKEQRRQKRLDKARARAEAGQTGFFKGTRSAETKQIAEEFGIDIRTGKYFTEKKSKAKVENRIVRNRNIDNDPPNDEESNEVEESFIDTITEEEERFVDILTDIILNRKLKTAILAYGGFLRFASDEGYKTQHRLFKKYRTGEWEAAEKSLERFGFAVFQPRDEGRPFLYVQTIESGVVTRLPMRYYEDNETRVVKEVPGGFNINSWSLLRGFE